jgi:hypothetical protein
MKSIKPPVVQGLEDFVGCRRLSAGLIIPKSRPMVRSRFNQPIEANHERSANVRFGHGVAANVSHYDIGRQTKKEPCAA